MLSKTDVNGQTTYYEYDTFKRQTKTIKPGDSSGSPSITYQYNNWGTINQQNLKTITRIDATHSLWQSQFFDGLGRVVQVQANGETGYTIISSTTVFNNLGSVDKQYVSQNINSTSLNYTTPDASWKYTGYAYDGLGWVTTQTNPDGTTISNDYSTAWQELVTNELGYKTRSYYDAFNRLSKVEELDASQQVYSTTQYSYDVLSNLTQVLDNSNNTTSITYDWLSRKTAMTDPDMGSWSYGYDSNGNMTTQMDAKSQTITFVYDAMNRLTNKNYPSGLGMTNVTYTYDSTSGGNYGKGQRTGMTDAAGSESYTYDSRGRLIEEKRTISSIDYTTDYTYDGADRIATIVYPTGETVTNGYNNRGLPYSVSGSTAGTLVSDTSYNQFGNITVINLGNTLRTTFGYYGLGGTYDTTGGYYGKLWEIKTLPQAGGTAIQDLQYTWDAGGNIVTRVNAPALETESFTYDFLDRLTAVSNAYTQSYAYNQTGNITSMNGTSYTYGTQPHAVTAVGSTSYVYDANGNMTSRGGQGLTWDVENRPTVVGTETYVYDGDGNRISKTVGGVTTLYINKYYEKNTSTGVVTTSYYLGDKLVATRAGTTLTYIHQDSLSSTSVVSDSSGALISSIKYMPFGSTRSGSVPMDNKFTGQRLDGTGLYYYGARYYDPTIGRFVSADPVVQPDAKSGPATINGLTVSFSGLPTSQRGNDQINYSNPQEQNRYSYVLNNPLKYADPTGNWIWAVVGGLIGAAVGFGSYYFTHQGNFNWGQAALWAGSGALIGAGLGWLASAGATLMASTSAASSPWLLNTLDRGNVIEDMLGGNLARNFPVIDKFINGVATSIKSIDLTCKSYQNISTLMSTIRGYVTDLAAFQGANWAGVRIDASSIINKVLQLAIPATGMSQAQQEAFQKLIEWAQTQGVQITFTGIQ